VELDTTYFCLLRGTFMTCSFQFTG